jgi:hypothetical protein
MTRIRDYDEKRKVTGFGGSPSPLDKTFANVAKHYGLPLAKFDPEICPFCGSVHGKWSRCQNGGSLLNGDSHLRNGAYTGTAKVRHIPAGVSGRDLAAPTAATPAEVLEGQVWVNSVGTLHTVARMNRRYVTLIRGDLLQLKVRRSTLQKGRRWRFVSERDK